ncbi:SCO1/SenC-domain-containing protein [Pelagophyceae sp. CCMP2097]|nr:SCO1/SenC-domain-containing protein [Pelagophyceae sp. CCMP2097]|mmetsp:Transcript_233/g.857  ORF Transcript_233/g.857 Transcript_233/m.857 type:complete len:248 (+) Transcript_233:96-839(+)|eukprot:CAMPEP_0184106252 /NCGR_PEP_ID=MMETSP0974-20121125/15285_1 /TAXON_ID=483370 /ORGANISM="non described non described, Strain CCMP2097" /LENGTH=247 /DNA_ID=CAMNT_0026409271 /DNA_START=62 /DNA_END=805 /DNA_ORIENTATION=-
MFLRRAAGVVRRPAVAKSAARGCAGGPKQSSGPKMAGPVSWKGLAGAGVVGLGAAAYYNYEKLERQTMVSTKQTTTGTPKLGGKWTLVDAKSGIPVTDATYHGQFTLMYFGFTKCPDICPAELVKMGEITTRLAQRGSKAPKLAPIFISIDGNRDTVGQLEAYAKDFDSRVDFLVGAPEQARKAAKAYRVYSSKAAGDDEDYLLDHSIVLYLTDGKGKFLDFFTQSTPQTEVVDRICEHYAESLKNP